MRPCLPDGGRGFTSFPPSSVRLFGKGEVMAFQWELVDDPALGGLPWKHATAMAGIGEFVAYRFTSDAGQCWYVETPRGLIRAANGSRASLIVKGLGLCESQGPFEAKDVALAKEVKPREGFRVMVAELIVCKEVGKGTAAAIASALCTYLDDKLTKPEGVEFCHVPELEGGLLVA